MIAPELKHKEASTRIRSANVQNLMRIAHHVDTKKVHTQRELHEFVAAFFTYEPLWIHALGYIRPILLRVLRAPADRIPARQNIQPATIRYEIGSKLWFFTVRGGNPGRNIVLRATNKLLIAHILIDRNSGSGFVTNNPTVSVTTIVRYRNRLGSYYFTLIRPFHHLIVRAAMNAAAGHHAEAIRKPRVPGFISISERNNR